MEDVFAHGWLGVVDVGEHEVVVVAEFGVDIIGPAFFAVADEFVDGVGVTRGVVVDAGEVVRGVSLCAVFGVAAGEIEAGPGFDCVGGGDLFAAV